MMKGQSRRFGPGCICSDSMRGTAFASVASPLYKMLGVIAAISRLWLWFGLFWLRLGWIFFDSPIAPVALRALGALVALVASFPSVLSIASTAATWKVLHTGNSFAIASFG